jgi:hypothetical protein
MPESLQEIVAEERRQSRWERAEATVSLSEYEVARQSGISQRQFAQANGIARTSLQYWQQRQQRIEAPAAEIKFFESPEGLAFLHRVVTAAHLVMNQVSSSGVRLVCQFLELSGLSAFVASSYGSQHKISAEMEESLVKYGQEQRQALGSEMSAKAISACLDETFHPEVCLVAIEPASNFILLESYVEKRDAESWDQHLSQALEQLPVQIIQATSDAGSALLRYAREFLGVHHSPDLFHIQQDLVKATALSLETKHRRALEALTQAQAQTADDRAKRERYYQRPQHPGRPPNFEQWIQQAEAVEVSAQLALDTVEAYQQQVQMAIEGIAQAYHPFDLKTGAWRSPAQVEADLKHHFGTIEQVATEASLSERSHSKIAKAKRQLPQMVETIRFFHQHLQASISAQSWSAEIEQAFQQLLPAVYLHKVAAQASDASVRQVLRSNAEALLQSLRQVNAPLQSLSPDARQQLEALAQSYIEVFQRSSSCVEGRNGQLALRHHSFHRLSQRKLQALTTIHNYFLQRPDGSTAAERFFGRKPLPLFDWLLKKLTPPARPAKKRPQMPKPSLLDMA